MNKILVRHNNCMLRGAIRCRHRNWLGKRNSCKNRSFEKIRGAVERLSLAARMDNSITRGQKVYSEGAEEDGLVKLVLGR